MIQQMKYFQSIVEHQSFTEAAEDCFISQSAISQQMKALEKELGVSLFDRSNRKFTLTPAGEYFYRQSLRIVKEVEDVCQKTFEIANPKQETLTIGCLHGYGGPEFSLALADFSQEHPNVSVQLLHGNHEELYEALRSGQADLVLNDQRRAFSDAYVNDILTVRHSLIEVAARGPYANLDRIEVCDLKDTPCILLASEAQEKQEEQYYRDIVGIQSEILFAQNIEQARLMVLSGQGYLPVEGAAYDMPLGTALKRLCLIRQGKPIDKTYCAFWKVDASSTWIQAFAKILHQQFEQ